MKHSARHTQTPPKKKKKNEKKKKSSLCRAEIVSGGRLRPAPPTVATTLVTGAEKSWTQDTHWTFSLATFLNLF